jgi:glycosyltransferase involved in cell wall biosynthesis
VLAEGLSANIRFLGFIDRAEQLALMQAAQAIVQPSLFEGWSTVVEDAKALGKFLILSDLPVHREQLAAPYSAAHAAFFDPHNPQTLADCIEQAWQNPPNPPAIDYQAQIQAFGQTLMDFLEKK